MLDTSSSSCQLTAPVAGAIRAGSSTSGQQVGLHAPPPPHTHTPSPTQTTPTRTHTQARLTCVTMRKVAAEAIASRERPKPSQPRPVLSDPDWLCRAAASKGAGPARKHDSARAAV